MVSDTDEGNYYGGGKLDTKWGRAKTSRNLQGQTGTHEDEWLSQPSVPAALGVWAIYSS